MTRRDGMVATGFVAAALAYPAIVSLVPVGLPRPEVNSVIVMMYYAILALGLNVVVGFAGLLDLGYVAFFVFGAYTTAFLASPHFGIHIPWWAVVWVAVMVAALWGILLGAPTLRLRGDYLAIVTLGFGEIVPLVVRNLDRVNVQIGSLQLLGPDLNLTGGPLGINPIDPPTIPIAGPWGSALEFSNINPAASLYLALGLLVLCYAFCRRLRDSRLGRNWMAIRDDEKAASSVGVDPVRTKLLAFAIGASFSGFAGAFVGAYQTAVFPETFKFSVSITILVCVILGGLGSLRGVVAGAFALQYVNQTLLPYLAHMTDPVVQGVGTQLNIGLLKEFSLVNFNFLLLGLILVVMMQLRPQGLFPASGGTRRPPTADPGSSGRSIPAAQPTRPVLPLTRTVGAPVLSTQQTVPLLEARGVTMRFGGLTALDAIDYSLPAGTIAAVIGPNGAGKTTFFNIVAGVYRPSGGRIILDGRDVTGRRPHELVRLGVGRTFQNVRLFGNLSAVDNVLVGMDHRMHMPWWLAVLRPPRVVRQESEALRRAHELLAEVGLADRHDQLARELPYGDQRRLEIARALATGCQLLLLDEPTAGMNPSESRALMGLLLQLRRDLNLTILLIEHNMRVALGISEHITVFDHGQKIAEGDPADIRTNPRVVTAYLGRRAVEAMR